MLTNLDSNQQCRCYADPVLGLYTAIPTVFYLYIHEAISTTQLYNILAMNTPVSYIYTKLYDLFSVRQKALCNMFYSQLSCD